jgi:hypothetical protein
MSDDISTILEKNISPLLEPVPSPVENSHTPDRTTESTEYTEELPFPVEVFEGTLVGDLIKEFKNVHRIPESTIGMVALGILSAACGKLYQLEDAHADPSYANLFIMIGQDRGTGKSVPFKILAKPLAEASAERAEKCAIKQINNETLVEIKKEEFKKQKGKLVNLDKSSAEYGETEQSLMTIKQEIKELEAYEIPSYYLQNASSEALIKKMEANDGVMSVLTPEGGEVLEVMMGKYNKTSSEDIDPYLCGYSTEEINQDRISRRGVSVIPTLSVLIMVQPYILEKAIHQKGFLERGLFARMLTFNSQAKLQKKNRKLLKFSSSLSSQWNSLIRNILKQREKNSATSISVFCSEEAREVFFDFYDEMVDLARGRMSDVKGELSRWEENAIRLSLNLWMLDGCNGVVTKDHAERAVKIVRWCGYELIDLLDPIRVSRMDEKRHRLLEAVRVKTKVRTSNLMKNHNATAKEIKELAEVTLGLKIWKEMGDKGKHIKWIGFHQPEDAIETD